MIDAARLTAVMLLLCLLGSCDKEILQTDDLTLATTAYFERNLPLCERLVERYLRNEQNLDKRWDAWGLLLKAINQNSPQPRASLECLDVMLVEFENDEKRQADILSLMGKYNADLHHYDLAARSWSAYLDLGELGDEQRVDGYRKLASMQLAQRHFTAGEETLNQCLSLPVPEHDKIYCMLDLADMNMAQERWQEVENLCQQILDASPDKNIHGIASYLRGDALEQLGKYQEALTQFNNALATYPNPAVIENRVNYLKSYIKSVK